MDIIKVDASKRDKLYSALDTNTRTFIKRGVSINIQAHSGKHGIIDIQVNGKLGIGRKTIVINYDDLLEEWIAISDGYEFHMVSLSEISIVIRNKITKMSQILTKI